MADDDIDNMYFKQDTCHTALATMALLHEKFAGRISKNSEVNWPTISCDLTTLDFFLWEACNGEWLDDLD